MVEVQNQIHFRHCNLILLLILLLPSIVTNLQVRWDCLEISFGFGGTHNASITSSTDNLILPKIKNLIIRSLLAVKYFTKSIQNIRMIACQ